MDSSVLGPAGRWQALSFESEALQGNPLGDPAVRPVYVWTPPGEGPWPAVYVLQGFSGTAPGWFNVRPWEPSFPQVVDELGLEAVVVLVDAFTKVGGSQFVDSPAVGNYHTYICDELVPFVDSQFRTNGVRAVAGKSSGGYGAMVIAMQRPDLFAGFATHAGDALFDVSYRREFAQAARELRDHYDGSFDTFLERFHAHVPGDSVPGEHLLIATWAAAAAYSAGELPFEVETGEIIPEVWADWLAWDPVEMAKQDRFAQALRGMRAIWIDAGKSDEYYLDLGAIAFRDAVAAAGVPDDIVHFELHAGGHFGTSWRYPLALAWLIERLTRV